MKQAKKYIKSSSFWDYKIEKRALKNEKVKKFWLARKINMADWQGIKKKDLEKYLPELDIRPEMKNLLTLFLEHA